VVVLDPGPALPAHLEAIRAACAGRPLRAVLVTHTHIDHSPAAMVLAAQMTEQMAAGQGGAPIPCIGLPVPAHGRQDASFIPSQAPADGERLRFGTLELQAVHTPGHASNHVCWWLQRERLLFTGDHLMQGSTVVIDPPDGDMAAYLASLRMLPARLPELAWLAPGHGFLMDQPARRIAALIAHREARRAKVLAALSAHPGGRTVADLIPAVYADVPTALHPVAMRSLLAHLIELRGDGLAREGEGGRWQAAA
jgi:glyoxylase-like metal-dependent hydrolase (beta-lactamase superfamily II)